ncbi:MAG: hypothetical protein JSV80_11295 [Acidobacteriota bacterium]|nr:MAG: hypothetical protein JSV80_11295 [Acidobacteriota bacterium]
MNRRQAAWISFGLLLVLCGVHAAAVATPVPTETGQVDSRNTEDAQVLEQIERDTESVLTGQHFSYDPTGRRDPFEPLIKTQKIGTEGKRPKGIAGMLISEIDLKGVVTDVDGLPAALFRGSDNRGYTIRVGDVVYDGRVISIDSGRGAVVFRQQVEDPRRIKPYRDVVKRLRPEQEEDDAESLMEEGT